MVDGRPFPYVMQQGAQEQEIRPAHVPLVPGSVCHGLEQVPVDGPTVVRVELRHVADPRPFRQVTLPDLELVERLDGVGAGMAHREEHEERTSDVFCPRARWGLDLFGQARHRGPGKRYPELRRCGRCP